MSVPGEVAVAPPDRLADLNQDQRAAVESPAEAPLLVIAGAGTGKTHTLSHRVAELILGGADPDRVLLLTFSRRAAEELGRRARSIVRRADPRLSTVSLGWSGTFHGVGARLLREYAARIGIDPAFTILDRGDAADLIGLVRHELGLSAERRRFPLKATCLAVYSAVVNTGAALGDVLGRSFPWCAEWEEDLRRLFGAYVDAKQTQHVLDYDDLLLYWARMVEEPVLAQEIGERFSHVLVDEYQDTNPLQAAILLGIKPDGRGVTVVGDDAQAIYGFRGASVRNILDFPTQFDPPARIVTLEQNYRSTQPILAAANGVIGLAAEGYAKELRSDRTSSGRPRLVSVADDAAQAGFIVDSVLARREAGIALRKQAVLFRASQHSARLEIDLVHRNVPFVKFGGLKFLEAAHVKDLLAVLRWIENPRDRVAGFRAVQLLPGIGPKTAARIVDGVAGSQDVAMAIEAMPVPPAAEGDWQAFAALAVALRRDTPGWPGEIDAVGRWIDGHLERLYDDAPVRRLDLEQLARIAATYPSRQRFLTELTLDPPEATSAEPGAPLRDEDYLILSTIHSAKGQEWPAVYLLNAVDGCLPADLAVGTPAELEEERRLLYVAMTRARDHLDVVVPQRFHLTQQSAKGDRHVYAGRTRFIPGRLLGLFESTAWPPVESVGPNGAEARQAVFDLAARMRAAWR